MYTEVGYVCVLGTDVHVSGDFIYWLFPNHFV